MRLPAFTLLGSGPTILMLHDACGSAQNFAPQTEDFAASSYRAVAWHMPGVGNSTPVEPFSVQSLARQGIRLIEALQHDTRQPLVLLGHGLGGMVALEMALRRPELLRGLILAATLPALQGSARLANQTLLAQSVAELEAGQTMPGLARSLLPAYTAATADAAGVELAARSMSGLHPIIYQMALQAQLAFDRSAALAQVRCPTLWLSGGEDPLIPAAQATALAQTIPSAQHIEMAGCGHFINLETPQAFTRHVLDFISAAAISPR